MNVLAPQPAAVHFGAVAKLYGRQPVLRSLTLRVEPGEFFGLVGVNGAGKTTCIKAMLDFCDIDAGRIQLFDLPRTDARARARLAYLPERFLPPYYLTGRDFLSYMSRLHGVPVTREDMQTMLARLDLNAAALDKPVGHYSKGMAQKLGLAACFLSRKDLYVLDEPMSGLDPKARTLVKHHLLELKARSSTVFFSTHLLADVQELCDRMGILHEGVLRYVGTPSGCCEAYGAPTLERAYVACISQTSLTTPQCEPAG
ncbi:MAG: ABC transporter ATP-binding protein [Gammaproteobacteria bacterium]|nr:ABC transporter ATP-binding protein [Gammaproteobacteria bacterium]NIR81885.1 ABC transporter ATP-binding protein [Gammaproteobacteria bacterium]NIR88717.1 ABC transporter ATP-binding protein [Gammaproteobacteria bacterium]NIU02993.1 ABC transporter ATP-binding protein [Gammaproteobacteria bacterium]NIV50514.1 ATP-binding cassette domain-containing protein [Gammaproteobacteria bacterium]